MFKTYPSHNSSQGREAHPHKCCHVPIKLGACNYTGNLALQARTQNWDDAVEINVVVELRRYPLFTSTIS
uniref:Uncharacterized protein n=1 Tax=Pararge aegeria TaxID=116150 RepID=S4NWW9_9NEOP